MFDWKGLKEQNCDKFCGFLFATLLFFLISYITQTECQRDLQVLMRSVAQLCLTLCNPMDCSPSNYTYHKICHFYLYIFLILTLFLVHSQCFSATASHLFLEPFS